MRKLITFCICLSFWVGCNSVKMQRSFNYEHARIPPDGYQPIDLNQYEEKYGQHDGVYLNYEVIIDYFGNEGRDGSWKYSHTMKEKILILNPEADWATRQIVNVEPDTTIIRVIYPDGSFRQYNQTDFKKIEQNGKSHYEIVLSDIQKGTIIENTTEKVIKTWPYMIEENVPLQFSIPCESLSYIFACPEYWDIQAKCISEDRQVPLRVKKAEEIGKKIISYSAHDVPAINEEPFMPFPKEFTPYLQFIITNERDYYYSETGLDPVQFWANNFKEQTLSYSRLNNGLSKAAEIEIKFLADSLVSDSDSDLEKVRKFLNFFYDGLYVGGVHSRGYRNNFKEIIKARKASATDATGLLQELLRAENIKSYYLLVHSAGDGYYDSGYMSNSELSMPALRIRIDGTDYIAFPWIDYLPITHIPELFIGQKAVVLTNTRYDDYLWTLPDSTCADNTVFEKYDLKLTENGILNVKEQKTLSGARAFQIRQDIIDLEKDETQNYLKELLTFTSSDVKLTHHTIDNLKDFTLPLLIYLEYEINNLVTITTQEITFATNSLFRPISFQEYRIDAESRMNPIKIRYNERFEKHISISYPESWTLVTDMEIPSATNEFGSLTGVFNNAQGQVLVDYRLSLKRVDAPKEDIGKLAQLIGEQSLSNIPLLKFINNNVSPD